MSFNFERDIGMHPREILPIAKNSQTIKYNLYVDTQQNETKTTNYLKALKEACGLENSNIRVKKVEPKKQLTYCQQLQKEWKTLKSRGFTQKIKTISTPERILDAPGLGDGDKCMDVLRRSDDSCELCVALHNIVYCWRNNPTPQQTQQSQISEIYKIPDSDRITTVKWFDDKHIIFGTTSSILFVVERPIVYNQNIYWKLIRKMNGCDNSPLTNIVLISGFPYLFSTNSNNKISIHDLRIQRSLIGVLKDCKRKEKITSIHFSKSRLLLSCTTENSIILWKFESFKMIETCLFSVEKFTSNDLSFIDDITSSICINDRVIVLGSSSGKMLFFDKVKKCVINTMEFKKPICSFVMNYYKNQLCVSFKGTYGDTVNYPLVMIFDIEYNFENKVNLVGRTKIKNCFHASTIMVIYKNELILLSYGDENLRFFEINDWKKNKKRKFNSDSLINQMIR